MSERQSAVERLADQWNTTPDWAPTVYDQGRADQRHEMTRQLLEAIDADRVSAGALPQKAESSQIVDERDPECVKVWPDCASMEFDPRCCRFPKSCSAGVVRMTPALQEVQITNHEIRRQR